MAWLWKKLWQEKMKAAISTGFVLAVLLLFALRGTLWMMMVVDTEFWGMLFATAILCGAELLKKNIQKQKRKWMLVGRMVSTKLFLYAGVSILSLLAVISWQGWERGSSGLEAMVKGIPYYLNESVMKSFVFVVLLPIGAGVGIRIFCARRKRKG